MRKRILITVVTLFMFVISTGLASAQGLGKSDVRGNNGKGNGKAKKVVEFRDMENEWSREAVMRAYMQGYVKGYEDGLFRPNQPLTHLEAIAMLLNAKGDVDDDLNVTEQKLLKKIPAWGQKYVITALEEGILTEDELKNFNPNQGIKRYEVCVYLARIAGGDDFDKISKKDFKDLENIPEEYQKIIQAMYAKGLVKGDLDKKFSPNRVLKRAEMAVILGNLEDNVLHRFDYSYVKGTITDIIEKDDVFTFSIDTDKKDRNIDVAIDAHIFLNGKRVYLDKLSANELNDLIDSQIKIYIKDNEAVWVKITADEENDDYNVEGTVEMVSEPDNNGVYTFTVATGDQDKDIKVNKDARVFIDGKRVYLDKLSAEELDDLIDSEIKMYIQNNEAIWVKITADEENGDYNVEGTVEMVSKPDNNGVYTFTVATGDQDKDIKVNKDARVFIDGKRVYLDKLSAEELDDLIDSEIKMYIQNNETVWAKITADEKNDDYNVEGTVEMVSEPDKNGVYTFTIATGDQDKDVKVNKNARVFIDGKRVYLDKLSANELDDLIDSEIKMYIQNNEVVWVRITTDDEDDN